MDRIDGGQIHSREYLNCFFREATEESLVFYWTQGLKFNHEGFIVVCIRIDMTHDINIQQNRHGIFYGSRVKDSAHNRICILA